MAIRNSCSQCFTGKAACRGGFPCKRCLRLGRECVPPDSPATTTTPTAKTTTKTTAKAAAAPAAADGLSDDDNDNDSDSERPPAPKRRRTSPNSEIVDAVAASENNVSPPPTIRHTRAATAAISKGSTTPLHKKEKEKGKETKKKTKKKSPTIVLPLRSRSRKATRASSSAAAVTPTPIGVDSASSDADEQKEEDEPEKEQESDEDDDDEPTPAPVISNGHGRNGVEETLPERLSSPVNKERLVPSHNVPDLQPFAPPKFKSKWIANNRYTLWWANERLKDMQQRNADGAGLPPIPDHEAGIHGFKFLAASPPHASGDLLWSIHGLIAAHCKDIDDADGWEESSWGKAILATLGTLAHRETDPPAVYCTYGAFWAHVAPTIPHSVPFVKDRLQRARKSSAAPPQDSPPLATSPTKLVAPPQPSPTKLVAPSSQQRLVAADPPPPPPPNKNGTKAAAPVGGSGAEPEKDPATQLQYYKKLLVFARRQCFELLETSPVEADMWREGHELCERKVAELKALVEQLES
ncbi:hypothetical protein BC828DRAFT_374687 [Blastocladiella britannica]|nr:hypothetical protein BC828DRAFT_374687 [Blastocladiella britannica]